MGNYHKLSSMDLNFNLNFLPDFTTTMEIFPFNGIIGQDRAVKSLEFGLNIPKRGYNIFASGHTGTGKTGYLINKVKAFAKGLPAPCDWCYVYNFNDSINPLAIALDAGTALEFAESVSTFISQLFVEVSASFNDELYEKSKNTIIGKYEKKIIHITNKLENEAEKKDFTLRQSEEEGFVFIPTMDGKEMDSDIYNKLTEDEKDVLNESVNELRLISLDVIKQTKALEKKMDEELNDLNNSIALKIISDKISILKNMYGTNEGVVSYLDMLRADIIENITLFTYDTGENADKIGEIDKSFFRRYEIKVIISNSLSDGAPVIFEDSPEYNNLFGKIEYENRSGNIVTDFTMLRPGSLHKANGGFIILNAYQLLGNPLSWQTLKRYLKSGCINIENSKENMELFPLSTLKPQGIPLNLKVLLIGDEYTYSLLTENDPDFNKLFKIKAEFDDIVEIQKENTINLIGLMSNYIVRNNLNHMTRDGVIELLKYSSRMAENRNYYSSSTAILAEILEFANIFADNENAQFIEKNHIKNAFNEINAMHDLTRKKILDMYKMKKYIVNLNGSEIGQINGLSVLDYGDCIIGQQHKITVSTFAGRDGIIDIERETGMGGSIHNKGIMILSGFIGGLLGQDVSLSFNASIVFEQLYSGIEGDSASAAELLALISSLSDVPIKQSYAITGSINQKGEIQPIGGVNDKIEGYFDICSIYGLDGSHGVIIPNSNLDDLILHERVLDAVNSDMFHIYSVSSIEDCLELFCSDEYKLSLNGRSIMEDIKNRIIEKLRRYNKLLSTKNM